MFISFRRIRKWHLLKLLATLMLLSVLVVCWDQNVLSHIRSYSYRYLGNSFANINKSLTISRDQARSFSSYHYLLNHPHKCRQEDVLLLLFVKSSPGNAARRGAIRSTWGNETFIRNALGATVKVLFALGAPQWNDEPKWSRRSGAFVQRQLIQEDGEFGDLIQQDFLDSFHNLTLKLILQFHWTHSFCPGARFFMSADDDMFVHMPNLVSYLQDMDSKHVRDFWVGHVHKGAPPVRSKDNKYYVSIETYRWMLYPDYTAGSGYVVSGDVAEGVYQAMLTLNASIHIDDVFMGICANAIGVSPQEHAYFSGEGKTPYHMCVYSQMMTSHSHEDVLDLWRAATHPQVKEKTSGLMRKIYCTIVKLALLCTPSIYQTYPCRAAFM
ncbi:lactosylceramide 1,3-N-acetyl-beta-D-glucosaminyltransferase B [Neosynchiropus ocellatus]